LVEQFLIRRLVVRIALPAHQEVALVEDDDNRIEVVGQNLIEQIELLVGRNPALGDTDVNAGLFGRVLHEPIDSSVVRFDRLAVNLDDAEPVSLRVREFENLLADRVDNV
jgi:hypothetical protein